MDFQSKYNRSDFLRFLRNNFLGDKFEESIEEATILNNFKSSFFTKITKLGVVEDFDNLIVLEIEHKSKNDARISLTKDIFKLLRQFELEGSLRQHALVILKNPDSDQYRFSLLTTTYNEDFEEKLSNPKRYSFLLGEGEKVKTAKDYLEKKGKVEKFEDLVKRFDVEVVRKDFFNNYLTLYIKLYKAILEAEDFIELLNKQKVDLVSFAKNLLGKIVFLYFIQKKGWLGVGRDKQYGIDGDKNFMRSIWDDFKNNNESLTSEKEGFFYNDYLEWLFYDGLNKDRRDSEDYFPNLKMKVPYLNGGLFKEDYKGWDINISKISNDLFSNADDTGILDIFDTYNFTIDEDDLYDSDIAIDPEMLGRIFEKMISISPDNIDEIVKIYESKKKIEIDKELNKKFGAFYTPREIVHYMTKESIISYLTNNLKGKKEDKEKQIRALFDLKEKFLVLKSEITEEIFNELAGIIEEVDLLLQKVKILDPAIGSGAFPMGILHEISTIRYYIYGAFYVKFKENEKIGEFYVDNPFFKLTGKGPEKKVSMYKIKRNIIQNSIYGVDISAGAIDIARLRFWLSLVVDEEFPEPLPNFEFKFVCANTLIPLADISEQSQIEFDGTKELSVETLRKYMASYYNSQTNKDKEEWKAKIEKFLGIGKNISLDFYNTKSERTKQLETYKPFDSNHSAEFFDPSLMMGNSKFDIVIGNPPYIGEKGNKEIFIKIKKTLKGKTYYNAKMDIFYFFFHFGLDFLKNDGIISYITTNYYLTSDGAIKLREDFKNRTNIINIINFNEQKLFDTAKGQHNIITILSKKGKDSNVKCKSIMVKTKLDYNEGLNIKILNGDTSISDFFLVNQENLYDGDNNYIRLGGVKNNSISSDILEKIKNNNFTLSKFASINSGCDITASKVTKKHINDINNSLVKDDGIFVLNKKEVSNINLLNEEKNILKPFIKSSDIVKYGVLETNNKLIYLDWNDNIEYYPNLLNHLIKFKLIMDDQIIRYGEIFPWFALHRPRKKEIFDFGEKIIVPYRAKNNIFGFSINPIYSSRDVFYIKSTSNIKIKFLLSILNSKLIYFWLYNRGKRKGDTLELYGTPLSEIPIKQISDEKQKSFIEKVDMILEITKQPGYNPKEVPEEQKILEKEIDKMVYELYGLSEEEVRVVEESLEK